MRRALKAAAVGAAGLGVLLVAAGALCRLALDCHLRALGLDRFGHYDLLEDELSKEAGAARLPAGFVQDVLARGLRIPTSFALLPDGRVLVSEKAGLVRVVEGSRVLPRPALDIRDRVNDHTLRGLLGGEGRGSCNDLPRGADCIPVDSEHAGGWIEPLPDGTLLVSTGDGWQGSPGFHANALRPQDLDSLAGKLLRVTPAGVGVPSNPFWNGDPGANRSKVWAYGLRNPFRFTLAPGSGTPVVADVGWEDWDEIDLAPAGSNLGWPCWEGDERPAEYAEHEVCRALYERGRGAVVFPVHQYPAASVSGGVFYTGDAFPARYRGAYVFGDWLDDTLRLLPGGEAGPRPQAEAVEFASEAAGPVQLAEAPDGSLLYLALNAGELRRIRYAGA